MDVYEITGFISGLDNSGVNFLDPADAFQNLKNGFVYRQSLQSRLGFAKFANRLSDGSRVMGIFENVLPDSTSQLLVFSKDFLYEYDSGANTFNQVPFNARILGLDAAFTLGIVDSEAYISGTTYLTKSGAQRFVFTSKGIDTAPLTGGLKASGVYFYDGTSVGDFFCTADNADSQEPASSIGDMVRATTVTWFGERLNFFVPQTTVATYNQGVLYSAIRDASGNGDKFNSAGAGLLEADTYELMKSALVLGDIMIMNFQRSSWTLKKTRDAFNPYLTQRVPSVLGTDAGFSAVNWNYEIKSLGKPGMVTTDGRQSDRFDNRLPRFTQDDVEQKNFELTYGGFDRENEQFLFAYRSNTSTLASVTQDEVLVYNYKEKTFAMNTQRFSCFGQTDQGMDLVWNDIDETQNPAWARMDETEDIWNKIGIDFSTQKTLAGDNLGFVYQINKDYDDYFVNISAITIAASAVVTVDESAFQIGDRLIFANVEGMTEINGLIGIVTAAALTSVTVNIDSSFFTAYTTGGTVSKTIDFEAKLEPFNPYRSEGMKCYVSHVEFLLNTNAGSCYVDIYEDEEEAPFKTVFLESSTTTTKARQWISVIVSQESNFLTFLIRNESAAAQTVITSIRVHCSRGAFSSS